MNIVLIVKRFFSDITITLDRKLVAGSRTDLDENLDIIVTEFSLTILSGSSIESRLNPDRILHY